MMLQQIWAGLFGKRVPPASSMDDTKPDTGSSAAPNPTLRNYTFVCLGIGALCVLLFSANVEESQSFFARAGAGFALALGAAVLGSLLGFVFGIPRTLQHDAVPSANPPADEEASIGYQINTNLEQISDWLTKIIVGVGLIELGNIGSWLMRFSESMGEGFKNGVFGKAFVLGTLIYFLGCSFLFGYLWTRLRFGIAIKAADKGLVERRIEKFEAEVRADNQALVLVARQLETSAHGSEPRILQNDLDAAILRATRVTKVKIFYSAVAARNDDERRERAIPVFQALIAADKQQGNKFHRNYAELGFALKDKSNPEWQAAESALTKAIEIRDRIGDSGDGAYEFNRAICGINLGRPKEEIVADFKKAAIDEWIRTWTFNDLATKTWMAENKISRQSLGFL